MRTIARLWGGGVYGPGWVSQGPQARMTRYRGLSSQGTPHSICQFQETAGLTFLLRALTYYLAHFAIKIFLKKRVANELWSRNVIRKVKMCPVISHTHSSPVRGSTVDRTISSGIFSFNQDCFIQKLTMPA